ncbi:MAG TPA: ATP-binding protein, partial [Kofleriaceae bacterium]|nr:ATP-binding protein [Kofleriaceae bacterium]
MSSRGEPVPARLAAEVVAHDDHAHAVQFYDGQPFVLDAAFRYLRAGITRGDACLVIAAAGHRRAIDDHLQADGVDIDALRRAGRVLELEPAELLASIAGGGRLNRVRGYHVLGTAIEEARRPTASGRVRAYGELVDVAWAAGDPALALALEELWAGLSCQHQFSLLCACALSHFPGAADETNLGRVLGAHTYVLPAEAYQGAAIDEPVRREIVRGQYAVRAMREEVRRAEELERAADAREADLHDFVENAVVGIQWIAPDGRILWANRAQLDLLGYSRDDYIGCDLRDLHVDRAAADELLGRLAGDRTVRAHEARLRRNDGSIAHVVIDASALCRDGALVHSRCFTRDITGPRRAHDALVHLHHVTDKLSASTTPEEVLDVLIGEGLSATGATAGAVFLLDGTGRHATLELARARGYRPEALEPLRRIPLDAGSAVATCVRLGRAIYEARAAVPMVVAGRAIGALELDVEPEHVFDEPERVFVDALAQQAAQAIERARLFASEREARMAAEAADRRKDEFLAILGHELRNPLAPIQTALELIQQRGGGLDREHDVLAHQVEHVTRLVDDLLDVARITRGKLALDLRPIALGDVIARAVEMTGPLVDERRHTLTADVAPGLLVLGDSVRLAQVMANLLTNAARYTEPGGHIAVAARREGADIVVTVADDGIGLDADLLPRIFDLFTQGRRDGLRQGGLGLGLALVRDLTELHGGSITADSAGPGRGSTFTVRLPAAQAPSVP